MKRVVGRLLQRVVVSDVIDFRIGARVMVQVCLGRVGRGVPAQVTRQRRRSRLIVWDLAGMGAAVISELGANRFDSVTLTAARVGRVLRRVVLTDGGGVEFRIGAPVMAVTR